MIALQEIWLESDECREDLQIPEYDLYVNSFGKGKGIATYIKKDIFNHKIDIKKNYMQLSKFTSSNLDVIVLYRSQQGGYDELNQCLKEMESIDKPQLVIGDFNFCYLNKCINSTKQFFEEENFSQLIKEPTHIEGNLLDQAHLRDTDRHLKVTIETHSKYYTDHKGLAIILKKGK